MLMSVNQKFAFLLLRLAMGWVMFYAGFTKLIDPAWSAAGYIGNSSVAPDFFAFLARPDVLPIVNMLNMWGLTLIGAALILGVFVRLSSFLGFVLMVLYYLPIFPPQHGLVDEHVIYALVFLVFLTVPVGNILGLDGALSRLRFVKNSSLLQKLLG